MYPDELLYSVFARYHKFSGNQTIELSYSELLGYKSEIFCNPVVLPRNLEYLSMQIQEFGISCTELLYKRTLFPYMNLFSFDYLLKLVEIFSLSIYKMRLGKKERDCAYIEIGPLKYCPICLEEEYETYGEAYWHRHHQIPGVFVCTKHRIALKCGQNAPRRYFEGFYSLEKSSISSIQNNNTLNTDDMDVAIQLANGIQWISDNFETAHKLWMQYENCFREVYFHLLVKKGFVTKHRVILITQFTRDIVRYYGKILSFFDLTFFNNDRYSWPMRVFVSRSREIEPIRHFLMMQYLSGSIQAFFTQLEHLKSYGFTESPECDYYFAKEPSLFKRDKEKFRIIWKRNRMKHNENRIDSLDDSALSALSWLYTYDYDWLMNHPQTERNAGMLRMFIENLKYFSGKKSYKPYPFSLSWEIVCGKPHRWDCPTARFSKRIYIKSLLETITAYKKWKLSHWYRASKKRVSASSAMFEFTIMSSILDQIEKSPSRN